ncbi:MAG: hypothetical protein ACRDNB_07190 [Gaiellaceae bacterium]
MRKLLFAAVAALTLAVAAPALAADDGSTTFGGATVDDGVATLVANTGNTAADDDFSGVTVPVPTGLTFGQITQLSTDFNVTDDDCGAGSPRFQIKVGGKNVFVYLGPAGTFTGCEKDTWLSSGNLVGTSDACRVDTSQFAGGTQCSTWAAAVTLLGSQAVEGVSLVVDASWAGGTNPAFADKEQTVLVRNVALNDKTFFVPKPAGAPKLNPTTACKAQQAALGRTAFNELWAKTGTMNGFGKCVSTAAKAQRSSAQSLRSMQSKIMNASRACKAKGLKGAKLGQCVAATDRVAATLTEAQEHPKAKKKRK